MSNSPIFACILSGRLFSPLLARLEQGADLTAGDRAKLIELAGACRPVEARVTLVREGDAPRHVLVVLDGVACRCKLLADGSRQILAYLLPGDICSGGLGILREMDHSVATISLCSIVEMPREVMDNLAERHPRIIRALAWAALADESTLREWLVGMGRRNAVDQMAHLFCELLVRLRVIGRTSGDSYDLPLTQEELADTLGLSAVHVNRSLQVLREARLIRLKGGRLTILDIEGLKARAGFNPGYLHLRPVQSAI